MPGLTELPSTDPMSLGATKVDRNAYANENYRAQAFLLNKIRTYLIQIGESVGLGNDSTVGSLGYRVAALEASVAPGGFAFNRLNLSQFATSCPALPAPSVTTTAPSATFTNPQLTFVQPDANFTEGVMRISVDAASGTGASAVWWADDLVPFQDYEITFDMSYDLSLPPAAGESFAVAVLFLGDGVTTLSAGGKPNAAVVMRGFGYEAAVGDPIQVTFHTALGVGAMVGPSALPLAAVYTTRFAERYAFDRGDVAGYPPSGRPRFGSQFAVYTGDPTATVSGLFGDSNVTWGTWAAGWGAAPCNRVGVACVSMSAIASPTALYISNFRMTPIEG